MTLLWVNLAIVLIFSFFARYLAVPVTTLGRFNIKPNKLMVLVVVVSLVFIAGLRTNIGDTYFYMHAYELGNFSWQNILLDKDIGFGVLQMLLKKISEDPQILILVTATITNVLIVAVLYNYSRLFELSLFVYITSGMFITSMNGIRQFLAAAIIFAATKYIFDGSWKKYMLVVLIASTFHQSALVLIPIYFVVRRKAWTGTTFVLLFAAIILVLGFDQFSAVLFSAIGNTQYGEYQSFSEGGANIIRVIVVAMPILFAYFGRERLRELYPNSDIIVNLSIVGIVIMLISTQNWIFARMAIYFGLYQLILIAWIITTFRNKDQKLIYYIIFLFYLVYFFYENVVILGLKYKSDYF